MDQAEVAQPPSSEVVWDDSGVKDETPSSQWQHDI